MRLSSNRYPMEAECPRCHFPDPHDGDGNPRPGHKCRMDVRTGEAAFPLGTARHLIELKYVAGVVGIDPNRLYGSLVNAKCPYYKVQTEDGHKAPQIFFDKRHLAQWFPVFASDLVKDWDEQPENPRKRRHNRGAR